MEGADGRDNVGDLALAEDRPSRGLAGWARMGPILGTWIFALDGYYLLAPIGLFIVAGIFMSACAVADLLFGSARGYCRQRTGMDLRGGSQA